jgi:hypothetical protein
MQFKAKWLCLQMILFDMVNIVLAIVLFIQIIVDFTPETSDKWGTIYIWFNISIQCLVLLMVVIETIVVLVLKCVDCCKWIGNKLNPKKDIEKKKIKPKDMKETQDKLFQTDDLKTCANMTKEDTSVTVTKGLSLQR